MRIPTLPVPGSESTLNGLPGGEGPGPHGRLGDDISMPNSSLRLPRSLLPHVRRPIVRSPMSECAASVFRTLRFIKNPFQARVSSRDIINRFFTWIRAFSRRQNPPLETFKPSRTIRPHLAHLTHAANSDADLLPWIADSLYSLTTERLELRLIIPSPSRTSGS